MDIALEILTLKGALVRAEVFPKKDGRRLVVIRSNKNKLTTDDEAAVITAAWVEAGEVIAKGFSSYREFIQENAKALARAAQDSDSQTDASGVLASASCSAFGVIYADPPWRYGFSQSDSRAIESQYPTMTDEEICALKVPAAKDAVLYLWAVAPRLAAGLRVMEAWGFDYKTCAVWDKEKMGMGYWWRGQHEILMVGTRGKFSPPPQPLRKSSVIRCPRGRHSAKPEQVRDWIAEWYPDVPKLEIFSRLKRPGWEVFGNQVEYDLLSGEDLYGQNVKEHAPQIAGASEQNQENL